MKNQLLLRRLLVLALTPAAVASMGCATVRKATLDLHMHIEIGSQPPPPSGYISWASYCSNQPGMTVTSNTDVDVANNTDVTNTPPPGGYDSWDAFNNNPSPAPPTGYSSWDAWLTAQGFN